jgi:type IV secretory pathway TraG/TraD family ATPase VirD4
VTNNSSTERAPLIRPHELTQYLGPDGQVMFMADVPKPILAKRRPYFKIPALRRLANSNPYVVRKRNTKRMPAPNSGNWKKLLEG